MCHGKRASPQRGVESPARPTPRPPRQALVAVVRHRTAPRRRAAQASRVCAPLLSSTRPLSSLRPCISLPEPPALLRRSSRRVAPAGRAWLSCIAVRPAAPARGVLRWGHVECWARPPLRQRRTPTRDAGRANGRRCAGQVGGGAGGERVWAGRADGLGLCAAGDGARRRDPRRASRPARPRRRCRAGPGGEGGAAGGAGGAGAAYRRDGAGHVRHLPPRLPHWAGALRRHARSARVATRGSLRGGGAWAGLGEGWAPEVGRLRHGAPGRAGVSRRARGPSESSRASHPSRPSQSRHPSRQAGQAGQEHAAAARASIAGYPSRAERCGHSRGTRISSESRTTSESLGHVDWESRGPHPSLSATSEARRRCKA